MLNAIFNIFSSKSVITAVISTRDLNELNRYSRDGFTLDFRGEIVIATKEV